MKKLRLELHYGNDVERHVFDLGDFEKVATELSCYNRVPPLVELIVAVKDTIERLVTENEASLIRKLVGPLIERALAATKERDEG